MHRNPLRVKLPRAAPIEKQYAQDFLVKTRELVARLDVLTNPTLLPTSGVSPTPTSGAPMALHIGLISGTSTDAVDAAIVEVSPDHIELIACHSEPIPQGHFLGAAIRHR